MWTLLLVMGLGLGALSLILRASVPPEFRGDAPATSPDVIDLTLDNFKAQVLQAPLPVIVDCYATWCGPCQQLAPVLAALATELRGQIRVGRIDIDAQPALASAFGLEAVPTLLFFTHGVRQTHLTGLVPRAAILEALDLARSAPATPPATQPATQPATNLA